MREEMMKSDIELERELIEEQEPPQGPAEDDDAPAMEERRFQTMNESRGGL